MGRQDLFLLLMAAFFASTPHKKTIPPDSLQNLVSKFYNFSAEFPQQKIHIHTNKPYYITGDDLYGKIYLINETAGISSKKIYVELINEENTAVKRTIVNGFYTSPGFSFHLDDSLVEGNYVLRAYTAWMAGFNNMQNIFSTYIHISKKADHIVSHVAYKDSTFTTAIIQLMDSLGIAYAGKRVHYEVLYNNKAIKKDDILTGSGGDFDVDISSIAKKSRADGKVKVTTNGITKLFSLPALNNEVDVQFLPEGGSLVNDIENNVALKAIDQYGHGTDVTGYIKNDKGVIVCNFKSAHLGMGKFELTPESGSIYTAFIQSKNRKNFTVTLPRPGDYSYQLSVINRVKDEIRVRVALGDSLYKKNKITYIIAASHGKIIFTSRGTDLYEENISLANFPEGIAQLSLFDSAMQAVSERLVYVHHPGPAVNIIADKGNYRQREKVTLKLKSTDMAGRGLKGTYSVSVTDDHVVKLDKNGENIKSHLLLSPYLKGYIEDAGYYFTGNDITVPENLDLLMLTHGWSRFTWTDVAGNARINSPKKDSSLSITGHATNNNNEPASGYAVSLFSASDNAYVGTAVTNDKGEFGFSGIDFMDSTSFIIQTKNPKGLNKEVGISIDPTPFPLAVVDRYFVPAESNQDVVDGVRYYRRFLYDSSTFSEKIVVLKEVTVSSTKRKVSYDESRRVSPVSYIITPEFIERYGTLNLRDVLYAVPGVNISDGHISFFGLNNMTGYSDPLFVLDGIESNASLSVNAHDIDFIEVLRGGEAAIYGMRGANGVVLVNTKRGKDAVEGFMQKGIKMLHVPGYHVQKEFYSPKYETDDSRSLKTKDERTAIYWNGNVATDGDGRATISFYTADAATTYTVAIEGVGENGELVHETFPVKRTRQ